MEATDLTMVDTSPPRGLALPAPVAISLPPAPPPALLAPAPAVLAPGPAVLAPAPAVPAPAVPDPARRRRRQPKPKSLCVNRTRAGKFMSVCCGPYYGGTFYAFLPDAADIKEFDHEVQNAMNHLAYRKDHGYNVGATAFSYMKRCLRTSGWIIQKKRPAATLVPLMSRKKHVYMGEDGTLTTRWI